MADIASSEHSEDLVPVYVPRDRVLDVYRFLGQPTEEAPVAAPATSGTGTVAWTREDFERLAATMSPGIQVVVAMLDHLVEVGPGNWVGTDALAEKIGVDKGKIRGSLSAFTRHIKARYGRDNWPMQFAWGPNMGRDPQTYYTVSPDIAEIWTAARGK